jgi:hypothetical protein
MGLRVCSELPTAARVHPLLHPPLVCQKLAKTVRLANPLLKLVKTLHNVTAELLVFTYQTI